jgi:hypothetical protein
VAHWTRRKDAQSACGHVATSVTEQTRRFTWNGRDPKLGSDSRSGGVGDATASATGWRVPQSIRLTQECAPWARAPCSPDRRYDSASAGGSKTENVSGGAR